MWWWKSINVESNRGFELRSFFSLSLSSFSFVFLRLQSFICLKNFSSHFFLYCSLLPFGLFQTHFILWPHYLLTETTILIMVSFHFSFFFFSLPVSLAIMTSKIIFRNLWAPPYVSVYPTKGWKWINLIHRFVSVSGRPAVNRLRIRLLLRPTEPTGPASSSERGRWSKSQLPC